MRPDRGRPARYGWWAPVAQCHKRRGGVPCFVVSRAQPPETPPVVLTPSDRKGELVPTGSSTGIIFRHRAVLPKVAVLLCTTSGREWIWSTSTSLSHSCIRSREELMMYSCIYVKNLFPMLDLVRRARSCVNSRTQNLTMLSEPFSCIDPVG